MKIVSLSYQQEKFLRENSLKVSTRELAKKIGCSRTFIQRWLVKNDLKPPADIIEKFRRAGLTNKTTSCKATDKFLNDNYLTMPEKRMATKLNRSHTFVKTRLRQLGLVKPREVIEKFIQVSRIQPGAISHNKGKKMSKELYEKCKGTMFRKGNLPVNTKYDGAISVRTDKTGLKYQYIRIRQSRWELLHRHVWKKAGRKIPRGSMVVFKDGNQLNCVLDNLECITREENMNRNTYHRYPKEIAQVIQLQGALTRQIRKHEKQNKRSAGSHVRPA